MGFREFKQFLRDNLSTSDYAKAVTVRNFYDMLNIRSYLKGEPLDTVGNLDESGMEEALATESVLPQYVFDYLNKYESKEGRIAHFPELLTAYFNKEIRAASGSFKVFLQMERDLRLILAAFRAKKLRWDVFKEMRFQDPEDEIVAQILAQKDAMQYEPPEKYEELKSLFFHLQDNPLGLQKALYEYRFRKINQLIGIDLFSLDRILAYMIELILIEKWQHLDQKKGMEIVENMLKEPS